MMFKQLLSLLSLLMITPSQAVILSDTGETPEIIDQRAVVAALPYEQVCRLELNTYEFGNKAIPLDLLAQQFVDGFTQFVDSTDFYTPTQAAGGLERYHARYRELKEKGLDDSNFPADLLKRLNIL